MVRSVLFVTVFIIFLLISKSYAEFYFSVGGSLNQTDKLKYKAVSQKPLFENFSITNTFAPVDEIVCPSCVYGAGAVRWDIHKVVSISESLNYTQLDNNLDISSKLSNQGIPSYNLAVGYKIRNFRIESEFKYTAFNSNLVSLNTNINVNNNTSIASEFYCVAAAGSSNNDQFLDRCNAEYSAYNSTENISSNYNIYADLLEFTTFGEAPYVNAASKVMYSFINFLYDVPLSQSFGLFTGVGLGAAYYKLITATNLPLNLNGNATAMAYQYKLGAYYNILGYDNFRFLVSLTKINSAKFKFKNFEAAPINSRSVDFGLMYIIG
ncbi:MAG: hypothetical protein FWE18_01025 [Alphaproteobacteria bacterium]|nr:hypothetical protein [Alphaproteobacteria bacterium]